MKTKSITSLTMAGLAAIGTVAIAYADSTGETRNLFETAGAKQISKDFEPVPDNIKTGFGILKFES